MGGSGEEEQPPIEEASLTLGEKLHIVLFWSFWGLGEGGGCAHDRYLQNYWMYGNEIFTG